MSLKSKMEYLEKDLKAHPIRISAYADFPFAIFRYSPDEEWTLRKEIRLLKTRVEEEDRRISLWSMSDVMWDSLSREDALEPIFEMEKKRGFQKAQEQVTTYLTDRDFQSVDRILTEKYSNLDPKKDIVFLWRLGSLSPNILRLSGLIERLHSGKGNLVPTVLFYPGGWKGSLNFMNIRSDFEPIGSYRVKVYGRDS